jgi:hypothetical protein
MRRGSAFLLANAFVLAALAGCGGELPVEDDRVPTGVDRLPTDTDLDDGGGPRDDEGTAPVDDPGDDPVTEPTEPIEDIPPGGEHGEEGTPATEDGVPGDVIPEDAQDEGDDCPADVVCVTAFPAHVQGTTVGGARNFDSYSCAPSNSQAGPERVYRLTVPGPGRVTVALDASLETGGIDIDVHLLSDLDPDTCLARGDKGASADVEGGVVWLVFDTYRRLNGTEGPGPFAADIVFRPAGALADNPLAQAGVPAAVAELAMRAYENAVRDDLSDRPVLTVIDFSQPSTARRLWTVNVETGALLVHDRVTHGIGSNTTSDPRYATTFSNVSGSYQSSLGLSRTAETYQGSNGYSLRLDGLEPSNDRMRSRAIVVHGAHYAEDSYVDENGYLGRSQGCPAIAMTRSRAFIDHIKHGTLIFSYYPDDTWLQTSPFLGP